MGFTSLESVLGYGQLLFAGIALHVGIEQLTGWRHTRRERPALWAGATALALAAILTSNLVAAKAQPDVAEVALFARVVAISALALLVLQLAAALAGPAPRWLTSTVWACAITRVALFPSTELFYAHRFEDGAPAQGPLVGALSLPLIILSVGYVILATLRSQTGVALAAISAGAAGTGVLAVASLAASSGRAELLTGYLAVPTLGALYFIDLDSRARLRRVEHVLARRQALLVGLTREALTTSPLRLDRRVKEIVLDELAADRCELSPGATLGDEPAPPARRGPGSGAHTLTARVASSAGVLSLEATRPKPFEPHDRYLLEALCQVVAAAGERERAERLLRTQATHDALTRLPNRILLTSQITHALDQSARAGLLAGIVLLDLDGFRAVNDVRSHASGDEVLVAIANRLRSRARAGDLVCRFGGDVFVVVCEALESPAHAVEIGRRLLGALDEPVLNGTNPLWLTASAGIALGTPGADAEALIRDADTAMHHTKAVGGNGLAVFETSMRAELLHAVEVRQAVNEAVERGGIGVHYQPIIDLTTGNLVGVEALARCSDGTRMLPAEQWIPVAEEANLIHRVGTDVLRRAGAELARWHRSLPDLQLAVNVSPRQLDGPLLAEEVTSILQGGIEPSRLCLEITESCLVGSPEAVRELSRIRDMGCSIALDDFGLGYSSLGSLARLPIDVIKIDRSFVAAIGERDGEVLIDVALTIASSFGLVAVAEGIETQGQANALAERGCGLGQGYFFGRPVPARLLPHPLGGGAPLTGVAP